MPSKYSIFMIVLGLVGTSADDHWAQNHDLLQESNRSNLLDCDTFITCTTCPDTTICCDGDEATVRYGPAGYEITEKAHMKCCLQGAGFCADKCFYPPFDGDSRDLCGPFEEGWPRKVQKFAKFNLWAKAQKPVLPHTEVTMFLVAAFGGMLGGGIVLISRRMMQSYSRVGYQELLA